MLNSTLSPRRNSFPEMSSRQEQSASIATETSSVGVFDFETNLQEWINQGKDDRSTEKRRIAVDTIKKVKEAREINLSLENMQLTSLPEAIGELRDIQELFLNNNRIKSLPNSIGKLRNLRTLLLQNNKLEQLPDSIGNLIDLRYLHLEYNPLTALPNTIGSLQNLQYLYLTGIHTLRYLPWSLGNCQRLLNIYLNFSSISLFERSATLSRCAALRNQAGYLWLGSRVQNWIRNSNMTFDLDFITNGSFFKEEEQAQINEWLARLEECKDYRNNKVGLAKIVCNILQFLKHKDFCHRFFALLDENLTRCGDRAAMLLNMIFLEYKLHEFTLPTQNESNVNSNQGVSRIKLTQINLLKGIAKTLTLRNIINERIIIYEVETPNNNNLLAEDVEIRLYYELQLKYTLGLVLAVDDMLASRLGKCPEIVSDEDKLAAEVQEKYQQVFLDLSTLDYFLANDREYGPEYIAKRSLIERQTFLEKSKIEFFRSVAELRNSQEDDNDQNAKRIKICSESIQELKSELPEELQALPIENDPAISSFGKEKHYLEAVKERDALEKQAIRELRKSFVERIEQGM